MKLVQKLDQFHTFPSGRQRLGVFECPFCEQLFVRTVPHGPRDKSCGCQRNKGALNGRYVHGMSGHPIYNIWHTIRQRCCSDRCSDYALYGGRGIKLCRQWRDFAAFAQWCLAHGWAKGLTLDRLDNDGNYTPDNCRFVSNQANCQHSRRCQITLATAQRIKRALAEGTAPAAIAASLSVSIHIVRDIKRGRTWRNATP
jgi:hypothetical protein